MDIEAYFQQILRWLALHGLVIALIVIAALAALKVAAVLNRKLFALLFKKKENEDSQKLAETAAAAVRWVLFLVIILAALYMILGELGVHTQSMLQLTMTWLLSRGLGIVLIVGITVVGLKASGLVSTRLMAFLNRGKDDMESKKRAETLSSVVRWLLRTSILMVSAVMILGQVGVQIGPIIAAAGVVGLAVGFGAQNLVADVISGFFILLEDQVRVGDVVQLDGRGGLVERITLRMIILRDLAGNVHYVRNGKIDVVTNMTKEYSRYVFNIGVAYRENVDEVIEVIKQVDEDLRKDPAFTNDILSPIEVLGLDEFADSAVIIKARTTTKPIQQWRVGREFNRRLKKKFDEVGIEIPYPHLTLYPGKDKQGDSPALKLDVEGLAKLSASRETPPAKPQEKPPA